MTFTISGNTKQYGPERWEFTPVSNDKKNPKAVKVTRWVTTGANGGWYVIWKGYHFLGNARIMWRDRIAQGWVAS
jgi:hypothetical protein